MEVVVPNNASDGAVGELCSHEVISTEEGPDSQKASLEGSNSQQMSLGCLEIQGALLPESSGSQEDGLDGGQETTMKNTTPNPESQDGEEMCPDEVGTCVMRCVLMRWVHV